MLVVSGHEVRCREDLNMSNKMCVCVVREGVQMILPVGSQKNMFTTLGLPENQTDTVEWEVETVDASL